MPRSESVVSLFIASPADVSPEREILDDVVAELNTAWSKNLAVRFEVVKSDSVRPGVANYAQEVINSQIGEDFDVLIAIFWGRIGTPTQSHISGTVEEINRALARLKRGENLEVMIYFKDAPIPPSKIDPLQLTNLHQLKEKLNISGCLYSTFNDESNFESMIRGNLSAIAQKFANSNRSKIVNEKTAVTTSTPASNSFVIEEEPDQDDYGLLDYMDIFEGKIEAFNNATNSLAEATNLMAERLTKRTSQLNEIMQAGQASDRGKVRKVIEMTSSDMDQYTHVVKTQVKLMREARIATFDAMSRALSLQFEDENHNGIQDLIHLDGVIEEVSNTTQAALENAISFQGSMERMPRMSAQLNRSKKQVVIATESVSDEMMATVKAAKDVRKVIQEILSSRKQ